MVAPIPANEAQRMERLRLYKVLDTPAEQAFDAVTRLAANILETPIALISLIDEQRQWFKARLGLDVSETPRELAFCAHAIMSNDVLIVPDATKNPLFSDNPLVTSAPDIRFYAGAPLTTQDGLNLGTVCIIDRRPREMSVKQAALLKDLSCLVVDELELRVAGRLALEEVAERRRIEQMKTAFVADVNHELRTPLTAIIGAISLLRSGVVGDFDARAKQLINAADRNATHLSVLINDLLDLAKFDAGKMSFDFRPVDLGEMVNESIANMSSYASRRGVKLQFARNGSAVVQADHTRLIQVMNNLLSNAAKFAPENSTVDVTLSSTPKHYEVAVCDRGKGVPPEIQSQLFGKFVQGRGEKSTGSKGSGLGLSIAKAIVEGHGGEIGYEPAPSGGARFFFTLPRA